MSNDGDVEVSAVGYSCRFAVAGAIVAAMATHAFAQDRRPERVLPPQSGPTSVGTWRFVRTPHPTGGPDAISIMRIADGLRSDPDLAGLMVRCTKGGFEVLVVLLSPFPPRARPQVTVRSDSNETRFGATVVPPGAALLMPGAAAELLAGAWNSLNEVFVEISHDRTVIKGIVPMTGLKPAMDTLTATCQMQ